MKCERDIYNIVYLLAVNVIKINDCRLGPCWVEVKTHRWFCVGWQCFRTHSPQCMNAVNDLGHVFTIVHIGRFRIEYLKQMASREREPG